MKLKHLRDALERIKDLNGEQEVEFADNPVTTNDGHLAWTNSPIQAVYIQEEEGPLMLITKECSEAITARVSEAGNIPGFGTKIDVDKDKGFVGITRFKMP